MHSFSPKKKSLNIHNLYHSFNVYIVFWQLGVRLFCPGVLTHMEVKGDYTSALFSDSSRGGDPYPFIQDSGLLEIKLDMVCKLNLDPLRNLTGKKAWHYGTLPVHQELL